MLIVHSKDDYQKKLDLYHLRYIPLSKKYCFLTNKRKCLTSFNMSLGRILEP